MERAYHWRPKWGSRKLILRPVGRITSQTRHASQSIAVLKCQPKCLLMDRPQWCLRLQLATIGAPWRGKPNFRKPQQNKNVGHEKQARLLCWHVIGSLPILLGLDERDQENKRVRYCDF